MSADAETYGAKLHDEMHGWNCDCAPSFRNKFDDYAGTVIEALERDGRLLPAGAEVREEWGCRLTWDDGHVEDAWRGSREAAQPMFDLHQRKRAENPGWRVTPTLIRRLHLTLPAETVEEQR